MTSAPVTAENTTTDSRDTATKIKSPVILRVTKIAFAIFFVLAIIFGIQLVFISLSYHRTQADQLLEEGLASTLFPWVITLSRLTARIIFLSVGTIIFWRHGNTRIGLLTAVFLVAFGIGGVWFVQYTQDPTSYIAENNLYGAWMYGSIAWVSLFVFVNTFPNGRFVPRWMILVMLFSFFLVMFWAMPSDSPLYAGNWTGLLFSVTHVPVFVLPLWGQIYRYRHVSTPIQRQQTKWVLYGLALAMILSMSVYVITAIDTETFARGTIASSVINMLGDVSFTIIPMSLAFAMLRSRLWDIDLLINRSLAYAVVAAVGVLIFFGAVAGLQLAIGQTQPLVALLIAAAFSAAIFSPLHKRVQKLVDRHIYGFRFHVDELRQAHQKAEIKNQGALSGKKLGSYDVLDVLGRGGMGEVYKATDGTHTYAIKTLLTDKANDPEVVKRFQREAEAGQALNHPNIARVHEIATYEGVIYIVMDYLDGQDLSSWLKEHKTTDLAMAHEIINDMTAALDYAHAKGFVHRDIKPSNIMLILNSDNETYRAVLMDFGITKIKDANTLTGTGAIGTIDYMAPEQIMDARAVDHRADIYALGIVLYEMLVGECPFKGGPGQVMFAHIQQPPPDPRDVNPDIPRPVAKAIKKALEKSPENRFSSALEMEKAFA